MTDPSPSSDHSSPPVLETSRLQLRPWRDTDVPGDGQGPDAASLRFMPAGAQPGPDDFPAWLARRRQGMDDGSEWHWCIADLATDEMLGNIQVFQMGPVETRFQGELGYWLRPGARGHGYIGEAIEAVVAHSFRPVADGGLGLVRLHAGTDSDNEASQAVLRSAGFRQWGADHQAWRRSDGSLSDGVYFELLASDFLAGPGGLGCAPIASEPAPLEPAPLEPAPLEAQRLRLRPWSDDDLPRLIAGLDDWMSGPVDESVARKWLARRRPRAQRQTQEQGHAPQQGDQLVAWCICDKATDLAVGNIDVFDIGRLLLPGGCELGYWTHPDSRGNGFMTEALRRLLPHLMGSTQSGGLGLRRVTARTSEPNVASQSVMRAAGMRQWGSAPRGSVEPDGTEVSQVFFAVHADELDPTTDPTTGLVPGLATGLMPGLATGLMPGLATGLATVPTTDPTIALATGLALVKASDEPITLQGNGIRLRKWRLTDVDRVVEACSDASTRHWLADSLPSPYTAKDARSFIEGCRRAALAGTRVSWCIADPASDQCLGAVEVMDLADARGTGGEIGYWTHPDARGRGVMSEALRLALRHAFIPREDGGLGRKRLRLTAAEGNLATQHVARTNGFVEVGRDRQTAALGDGSLVDHLRFDLLVEEWNAAY